MVFKTLIEYAKTKKNMLTSKENGDEKVLVTVILIVVAIALCVVFKTQIGNLFTNFFPKIETMMNNLLG